MLEKKSTKELATASTLTLDSVEYKPGIDESIHEARVDGGWNSWIFVLGASVIEGLLYGFPLTFGVFQKYYKANTSFGDSTFLPVVGTLAIGVAKLGAPLMVPFIILYPGHRKYMIWVGWLLCICCLIASSFSTELCHLILTLGFGFGISFMILYYPLLSMLEEWWIVRRGFAYGFLFGCGGIFGLVLPLLIEKSLDTVGDSWTLRGFALLILTFVGPTLPVLRGPRTSNAPDPNVKRFDTSIFAKISFASITFSNLAQGLIFFLPNFFIPSYATSIGLSTFKGTMILSLTNITTMISQIGIGYLADRSDALILMFCSTFLSAVVSLSLWGLSKNLLSLMFYGALYGLFAGGYSVLYCRFATALTDHQPTQTWLYSIFESQRGLVIIAGGILSGNLVQGGLDISAYGLGEYERLTLFVGISLFVSSIGSIGWFFRGRRLSFASRGVSPGPKGHEA